MALQGTIGFEREGKETYFNLFKKDTVYARAKA